MSTENPFPENPFQSSEVMPTPVATNLRPSNRSLWRAYLFAPAVAPLVFVFIVFAAGFLSTLFGGDANEAALLVLPMLAMTVGLVSCYLVAGVIGMPIAFYLRRIDALNAVSIHLSAFGWAMLFTTACALWFIRDTWTDLPLAFCYVGAGVIPSVLLSGTAFWLLVKFFMRWDLQRPTQAT
jgi:hypothetical protein